MSGFEVRFSVLFFFCQSDSSSSTFNYHFSRQNNASRPKQCILCNVSNTGRFSAESWDGDTAAQLRTLANMMCRKRRVLYYRDGFEEFCKLSKEIICPWVEFITTNYNVTDKQVKSKTTCLNIALNAFCGIHNSVLQFFL